MFHIFCNLLCCFVTLRCSVTYRVVHVVLIMCHVHILKMCRIVVHVVSVLVHVVVTVRSHRYHEYRTVSVLHFVLRVHEGSINIFKKV